MKKTIKIPTILGLVILIVGLIAGIFAVGRRQLQIGKASGRPAIPANVTISNVSDRSFTVSWITDQDAIGFVKITPKKSKTSIKVADDRDKSGQAPIKSTTHYVNVESLSPLTEYQILIGGEGDSLFDQNGSPFLVTTGSTSLTPPTSDISQGTVVVPAGLPAEGAIVYAHLPNAQVVSSLVNRSGNWIIPLSMARSIDNNSWAAYDRTATIYAIRVEGAAAGSSDVTVTTSQDNPVPTIKLGNNYDFRRSREPIGSESKGRGFETAGSMSLFDFSSLGPATPVGGEVTLENPKSEGEIINTDKPEFFGQGAVGTEVEVVVESADKIIGQITVAQDGRWSFPAPADLADGKHKITLKWADTKGVIQTLTRTFVVEAAAGGPAFTATPSATPTVKSGTKLSPTPTPPPRTVIPPSTGGTPKSGGLTATVFMFIMGTALIILGSVVSRRKQSYG